MIKRLSFVRRGPTVDTSAFAAAWRAHVEHVLHSAPPAAMPERMVHCVVRDRRGTAAHHGVGVGWFTDADSLTDHDDALAAARDVGAIVESAPPVLVEERCAFGADWLDARWHRTASSLLLIGLIQRGAHLSRAQFADYWWSRHRPLVDTVLPPEVQPSAYVHNYVLDGEPCEWDGIGEIYEASLDAPRQRAEWLGRPEIVADEERFLLRSTRTLLVTDQELVVADGKLV